MGIFNFFRKKGNQYKTIDIYNTLRNQALSLKPDQTGLQNISPNQIYGILMETGYKEAVATFIAITDGAVSLYFSNGGGIIGLGEHKGPKKACYSFIEFAQQFLQNFHPAKSYSLPDQGNTKFYFLTPNGVLSSEAKEKDLGNNRHCLSPLFHKAHEVITEARLVDEKRKQETQALLHYAATGNETGLNDVIKKGINLNICDPTGLSSLMAAAHNGHDKIIKILLYNKVKIEQKDEAGYTALMFACNKGNLNCAKLLVENGADVNAYDNDGSTPIMFCSQYGHNDIVKFLLSKGADAFLKGNHGFSAIDFAKQNKLVETEKILNSFN